MSKEPILPITHQEQLALLQSRGMTVREPELALQRLQQVNYARLKGYLLPFQTPSGNYLPGTDFERVYGLYVFDARLRGLLFPVLSEVELGLRSNLSYYFGQQYGAFGYCDSSHFENPGEHSRFMRTLGSAVRDEDNAAFLSGHRRQNGRYPVWVVLELLSMGGLSHFLANMLPEDRRRFSTGYYRQREWVLTDWTDHFTLLRNAVAHFCRLYFAPFPSAPVTPPKASRTLGRDLFDYIVVTRGLYLHPKRWNESFLTPLRDLIGEYAVDLLHIGFPQNWYELLAK